MSARASATTTTSPSTRTPTIACLRKPSCRGSVTATIWITPASWSRATRWRTAASERPTARAIVAYERRPSSCNCSTIALPTSSSKTWGAPAVTPPRLAEFEAESTRIRCQTVSGTRIHRRSRTDASKYVVQGSSILAAEFTRPEAAMSTHSTETSGPGTAPGTKGLKGGALGLLSSVVIGMASTAPAYSLAASLGFIVVIAGEKTPAIMLLAFVPMYLIAVAYRELNQAEPDCGTTFTWAARAFGPRTGWMGGWGIIAADIIVMANLAQIAGSYSFRLVGLDELADDQLWSTVAGIVWIVLMTYICYRGIEVSARVQYGLLSVEVLVLVVFSTYALVKVYSGNAPPGALHPSLSWLVPTG